MQNNLSSSKGSGASTRFFCDLTDVAERLTKAPGSVRELLYILSLYEREIIKIHILIKYM